MTSMATTIRIDPKVKEDAAAIFDQLGINMSAAINAFLKAVIREQGMPFEMSVQNKPSNLSLNKAFAARKDEFYTTYEDVEKEMAHYTSHFSGRTVFCNCDDPFESAFFRYFLIHFNELGLEKLIATSYAGSKNSNSEYYVSNDAKAYKAVVTVVADENLVLPDQTLDLSRLFTLAGNELAILQGDGDFRSEESVALLDEADIVATNPPFSLFRDYLDLLIKHSKKFIIIGNMNASTTREIFPLFRDTKIWYGSSIRSGDRKFYVPEDYPLLASSCGVDPNGRRFIRVKGVRWFTNLDIGLIHKPLQLKKHYDPVTYPKYDNYDAIEVGRTANIPMDFDGVMGVPISYLDKHSPDQFEILMLANGNARTNVPPQMLEVVKYKRHPEDKGGVAILEGKRVYARIFIKRIKHAE